MLTFRDLNKFPIQEHDLDAYAINDVKSPGRLRGIWKRRRASIHLLVKLDIYRRCYTTINVNVD